MLSRRLAEVEGRLRRHAVERAEAAPRRDGSSRSRPPPAGWPHWSTTRAAQLDD